MFVYIIATCFVKINAASTNFPAGILAKTNNLPVFGNTVYREVLFGGYQKSTGYNIHIVVIKANICCVVVY